MALKRKTSAGDASTAKRQKKVMSLSHKVDLLDWLLKGQSVASVGHTLWSKRIHHSLHPKE